MGKYTITEPHPTVAQNAYTYSGRGGAGNAFRAPATTPSAGVAYPSTAPVSSGRFYSGRGGAGNAHSSTDASAYSFDEEYYRAENHEKNAAVGHVGRGGAGNVYGSQKPRKDSDASSRRSSGAGSNSGSVRAGFWGRVSGASLGSR